MRAAELIAATCLATDLGMGFPFEHGLRSTIITMRLAERLGVGRDIAGQAYYACLLAHAGCTTDAHVTAEIFGGSLTVDLQPRVCGSGREVVSGLIRAIPAPESAAPMKALQVIRRLPRVVQEQRPHLAALCDVAQMLAAGVGVSDSVQRLLAYLTERWDGRGPLRRARGDQLPLPMRIVHVALDANLQSSLHGHEHAVHLIEQRAGHAFDPDVAACFVGGSTEILTIDDHASSWNETLALEPPPHLILEGEGIDRALRAMGNFADLISPYFSGHSVGVAEVVEVASEHCRVDAAETTALRRAALVHDVGRVAIGARTWEKPGPLSPDEWEQVRLHPYHTERVLSRSPFLARLGRIAGAHHERLDGSGYHRGASGPELPLTARLLAAADAYLAMRQPRSFRAALPPDAAADALAKEARDGKLDADAVTAVIEAAGGKAPQLQRPAGLTERETEVVAMLARGSQTKQVARALGISVKTADRHIQNAYRKIGVSSRAAATLFAMEHGLVAWGELPMGRVVGHS